MGRECLIGHKYVYALERKMSHQYLMDGSGIGLGIRTGVSGMGGRLANENAKD